VAVTDALHQVLAEWRLGPIRAIDRATSGMMNETFIVTTADRRVVLRRHRRTELAQIEYEHAVIAHASAGGIPTPAALITPAGTRVVEQDGAFYSLFAFARGHQVTSDQLSLPQVRSMGELLGRLHLALVDFPAETAQVGERQNSVADTMAGLERMLRLVEQTADPDEHDRWAAEHLRTKRQWLATNPDPIWQPVPAEAVQQVHGDYQETNLFFAGDAVVDVIDWDKSEARWPLDEIVRTLDLSLGLRPELCASMITGYRSAHDLSLAELDVAASNYSYDDVHGQWLFDMIYVRHDDRLRIFLEPGPFVPFTDRWAELRTSLH
jgi:Ser/Thr protein kinase RdoA (MazF antagonist)